MSTTSTLPKDLYTAAQVRALDARAAAVMGVEPFTLMERAGAAAFDLMCERWPELRRIAVIAGPGNNGGDAFVVARLARRNGIEVHLYALSDPGKLRGPAAEAYRIFVAEEGRVLACTDELPEVDLIVDGLLGTGLDRPVEGTALNMIRMMNAAPAPVFALDLPSGLSADSGAVLGEAVKATQTLTFIGVKQGLLTGSGPARSGELAYSDLAVPPRVFEDQGSSARRLDQSDLADIPPRSRDAHKGSNGHVLVVGGDHHMGGAVLMAGQAALRSGAGLVTLATREAHRGMLLEQRPELMVVAASDEDDLAPLVQRADVVALGPGLGQEDWGAGLFEAVLFADLPTLLDADALNLLALQPRHRDDWILTPHPGEAARLLGTDTAGIQADRYAAVIELRDRYGGVVVLKGAGTLIAGPGPSEPVAVCPYGNPGMATAGMGDVLAGVIAALLAQFGDLGLAARLGVLAHAIAGDRVAAVGGERGLVATDLLPEIRALVNP
jgi:ADP-dependent NAD(P)H-hydrate dehydratase / NAD(P)H-hydrate epimerase